MLSYSETFSSYSVDSISEAKEFYGNILGIETKESMGLELHLKDGNAVFLYEKKDHQPATFTVLNFKVDDIEKAVDKLTSKGIQMERYPDMPADEKGIFRGEEGPVGIAWFTDPAGNILSVLQEK